MKRLIPEESFRDFLKELRSNLNPSFENKYYQKWAKDKISKYGNWLTFRNYLIDRLVEKHIFPNYKDDPRSDA